MEKFKSNFPLLRQYLVLYIMLAFLPTIITTGALFFSYQALESEIVSSNLASLQLISQSLDPQFQKLNKVFLSTSQDPVLTKYALKKHSSDAYSRLQEILGTDDFINNIVINVSGEDYFYTAKGNYESDTIIKSYFINDLIGMDYTYEEWHDKLLSVAAPTFWPTNNFEKELEYLYYFAPLTANLEYKSESQKPSRNAVILIPQSNIRTLFQHSQTNVMENNLLFNSEMELLSHFTPSMSTKDLKQLCDYLKDSSLTTNISPYNLNGEKYLIFTAQSSETGLYYVRFLSEKLAFQSIYLLRTYTIIILVLATSIGTLLIFYGIKRNYQPIRNLAVWMRETRNDAEQEKNELVYFKKTFDNIHQQNYTLMRTINDSKHSLIDHLLTSLIQGNFSTEAAFQNACQNINISLNKKYFSVCSIYIENITDSSKVILDLEHIQNSIYAVLPENLQIQIKDLLFEKRLLLVLSSDTNDSHYYQSILTRIKQQLYYHENLIISIGVGSFYESYEQVGKSYLESQNALDYRMIYGKDCLIMPETYCYDIQTTEYPSKELKKLEKALTSHNIEAINTIIQALINYTKSTKCNLHIAKYICYDVFATLKKVPAFTHVDDTNSLSQILNIIHLTDFNTIDEFFTSLLTIIQNSDYFSTESNTYSSNDIEQQLVDYIDAYCLTYDFQINSMAAHFNISRQHMLKLFKNKTGTTLSEYVTNKKLEKAMQLLSDTDMPLSEIVKEIGNTDVSGFIRLFKQKTRLTPTQYRNNTTKE